MTGSIVGGHQRYKVLAGEDATEIDCVVVHIESPQNEKTLNITLKDTIAISAMRKKSADYHSRRNIDCSSIQMDMQMEIGYSILKTGEKYLVPGVHGNMMKTRGRL